MRKHFDRYVTQCRKIGLLITLFFCSHLVFAVDEPQVVTVKGSALLNYPLNSSITTSDPVFGTGGWSNQQAFGVQNIVLFEIDFNNTANTYFQNLTFTATCTVDINCYGNPSSPNTITQTFSNIALQVNFNPVAGATYKGIAEYKFNGAYRVDVIYKGISAPALSPLSNYPIFSLTNKLIVNRQYNFIDNSTDIITYTTDGKKLTVNWLPTSYPGAESFDLEWTYVDKISTYGNVINVAPPSGLSQAQLEAIFRNNSSRVNVPGPNYQLNLNYNEGYVLFRIRGVQFRNSDGIRLEGNWNYAADALPNSTYHYFDQGIVYVPWHEADLNWQYNATYAEEGKKKEVITYFDGSLRSRQNVTLNNQDNVSVVAEPIYDALGRPAMNILPTPVFNENQLKYYRSFNVNNSGKPVSYLDIPYANCTIIASPLSNTSGVEKYYSSSNQFMSNANEPWHKAIPKSEGFPFAVKLYTPDNTGRVRAQGGIGIDFQLGTNHETKYYYGKPSQYELDRIFGAEAGDHTHYLKNMVRDPNGQVSVSYLNSRGKTVATALAGLPADNMEAIAGSGEPTTVIRDIMLTPSSFQVNSAKSSLEATNTFLIASTGNYKFTYRFVPEQYNETFSGGTLCYTCSYDLLITLKDECGTELQRIETKNITPFNTSCSTPTELSSFFNKTLNNVGEYTVYFELAVNKETLDAYTEHYLQNNTDIKKLNYFLLEELIQENLAQCYNDCEGCKALPATQAEFINLIKAFYDKENLPFGSAETNYAAQLYATIQANCTSLSSTCLQSPCDEVLDIIKADVTPGGQYAEFDADYNLIDPEINVLRYFQTPYSPYSPATIEDDNGNIIPVSQLTLKEFIESFQESWAASLAPYHPEYCYYNWCLQNGASQAFNQKLENMNDPTEAVTANYFNRNNVLALVQADPFFMPGGFGHTYGYHTLMQNDLNNYSVNVLNITTQNNKNIFQVIDYLLYCGNQNPVISWDNCNKPINDPCRSDFKEWLLYKEWYLDRKMKYYTLAMKQEYPTCSNCFIPSSGGGDPGGYVNCIAPPVSDFSIEQVAGSAADGFKRIIIKYKGGNEVTQWPLQLTIQMNGTTSLTQDIVFTPGFGTQEMLVQDIFTSFSVIAVSCVQLTGKPAAKTDSQGSQKEKTDGGNFNCPDESYFTWSFVPGSQGSQIEVCYTGPALPPFTLISVTGSIHHGSVSVPFYFEICWQTSYCKIISTYIANSIPVDEIRITFDQINCTTINDDCANGNPCLSTNYTIDYVTGEVCGSPGSVFTIEFDAIDVCSNVDHYSLTYDGSGNCMVFPNWNYGCPLVATSNFTIYNCEGREWQCPDEKAFEKTVQYVRGGANIGLCYLGAPIPPGKKIVVQVVYHTACGETEFTLTFCPNTSNCQTRFFSDDELCPSPENFLEIKSIECIDEECGEEWECPTTDNNFYMSAAFNSATQTWDLSVCYTGYIPPGKAIYIHVIANNFGCGYSVDFMARICAEQPCFIFHSDATATCSDVWEFNYKSIECRDEPCETGTGGCIPVTDFTANIIAPSSCSPTIPGFNSQLIRVTHTGGPVSLTPPMQRVKVKIEITTYNSVTQKLYKHYRYVWFVNGDAYKDICYQYPAHRSITGTTVISTQCFGPCPPGDCCDDPRYSLYEGKVRRFQDYIEPDFSAIQNSYYANPANTAAYPVATCKAQCEIMADGWILDLKNCTTDPVRLERIRRQLINVCKQSCVAQQGSLEIWPFADLNPQPSFESIIAAEFGTLTPDCAYDLISDPYPWGKIPVQEKTFATEASTQVCNRLQQLISESQAQGYGTAVAGVHQYLKDFYNPYYDLEDDELQQLFDACQGCNGIMKLPVELPPFMNGNFKDCLPCTVFEQKKAQFLVKYPGITPAHDKYEVLFRNYLNHQTGFSHAYANYYDFEQKCTANENNFRTYGRICETPMSMEMDINTVAQCMEEKFYNALSNATVIYTRYIEEVKRVYRNNYTTKCLSVKPTLESEAKLYEYHYTLYYYDQSDNLVKTVPPKGVDYLSDAEINTLWADRNQFIVPSHTFATTYQYNSLNQLIKQFTPDGGTTELWYDKLGRNVVSQNEEQKNPLNGGAANRYKYIKYEQLLGRIIETGEKYGAADINTVNIKNDNDLQTWLNSGTDIQITSTVYDQADIIQVTNTSITSEQHFYTSRKRVVATIYRKLRYANPAQYDAATHYSYDILGNAKVVWQENARLKEADAATQGVKRIDYDFDLISGKINKIWYQKNKGDQFIYAYKYDAENRVLTALTSRDGIVWQNDASYRYYLHGVLARTELGSLKVQGIDYAYTIQGLMKHINGPQINEKADIARDGDPSLSNNVFGTVARDALGFSISYHNGDYKPIGTSSPLNYTESIPQTMGTGKDLFNGNIRATILQLSQLGTGKTYSYSYDQLNRIVKMRKHETSYSEMTPALSIANPTNEYQEDVTYDPNGNIMTYIRNGLAGQTAMDDLSYHYVTGKNQLEYVGDVVLASAYPEDVDGQSANNYDYDRIGNLIKDAKEQIGNIEWTLDGKIRKITKTDPGSTTIEYEYDAAGNRIYKKLTTSTGSADEVTQTYYVRDVNGHTLAIYTKQNATAVKWSEQHLYGSSRIGIVSINTVVASTAPLPGPGGSMSDGFDYGKVSYELTNHLGNVLITISDKKTQVQNGSTGTVHYYMAEVITATDYYPFGMAMPGRKYEPAGGYRFGFNGKEKDKDINSLNAYDYGFRIYNPGIARFLTVDPLFKTYPYYTPYQFASNSPIVAIDVDGLESSNDKNPTVKLTGSKHLLILIKEPAGQIDKKEMKSESDEWDYVVVANMDEAEKVLKEYYKDKTAVVENLVIKSHGQASNSPDPGPDFDSQEGVGRCGNPGSEKSLKYIRSLLTNNANVLMSACSVIQGAVDPKHPAHKSGLAQLNNWSKFWLKGTSRNLFMNNTKTTSVDFENDDGSKDAQGNPTLTKDEKYSFRFDKELISKGQLWSGFVWTYYGKSGTLLKQPNYYQIIVDSDGGLDVSKLGATGNTPNKTDEKPNKKNL